MLKKYNTGTINIMKKFIHYFHYILLILIGIGLFSSMVQTRSYIRFKSYTENNIDSAKVTTSNTYAGIAGGIFLTILSDVPKENSDTRREENHIAEIVQVFQEDTFSSMSSGDDAYGPNVEELYEGPHSCIDTNPQYMLDKIGEGVHSCVGPEYKASGETNDCFKGAFKNEASECDDYPFYESSTKDLIGGNYHFYRSRSEYRIRHIEEKLTDEGINLSNLHHDGYLDMQISASEWNSSTTFLQRIGILGNPEGPKNFRYKFNISKNRRIGFGLFMVVYNYPGYRIKKSSSSWRQLYDGVYGRYKYSLSAVEYRW